MPEVKRFSKNGMILKTRSRTDMAEGELNFPVIFLIRDVLLVAPELIGKILVVRSEKDISRQIHDNRNRSIPGR